MNRDLSYPWVIGFEDNFDNPIDRNLPNAILYAHRGVSHRRVSKEANENVFGRAAYLKLKSVPLLQIDLLIEINPTGTPPG